MRRGLICLLLLAMAAATTPALAMTPTYGISSDAWPTTNFKLQTTYLPPTGSGDTAYSAENNSGGTAIYALAQSFSVVNGFELRGIAITINGPAGTYPLALYYVGVNGGNPLTPATFDISTATRLWSGSMTYPGTDPNERIAMFSFDAGEVGDVNAGGKYMFVITETASSLLNWYRSGATAYTGGTMYRGSATANTLATIRGDAAREAGLAAYGVIKPGKATSPSPANAATDRSITQTLSWTADANATSHNVYFGTASTPPFIQNQSGTTYDPGTLTNGTTYYWRIDENDVNGATTGDVWSFTTIVLAPVKASGPSPDNAATDVGLTATLSWTAGARATSHDVYFGTASTPPSVSSDQAGTTYNPGTLANATTYYWRIDEKNAGGTTTGDVWSFTTIAVPAQASSPSPANAATDKSITQTLSWTAGAGATSHDVYFGTTSPGTLIGNQAGTTYNPGTLTNGTTYYWRIDEKNGGGTTTGSVWHFTTIVAVPAKATHPTPADGAREANLAPTLSWTAGARAASHHVYFGTSSPGTLQGDQTETTFTPGTLDSNTTYYWRIDENNVGGTTTGDVWHFTTQGLTIKKCTVKAGATEANDADLGQDATDVNHIKDSFTASGTIALPTDRENISYIDINIVSGDGSVIYSETIDFNDHNDVVLKHGKYSYSHKITKADPNGAITSLKMAFSKTPQTFAITAKNINLTGLASPVRLEFVMGGNLLWGDANEAIVNGKNKLIPTRLMRMYQDTLIVTKATAKHSTKPLSDSLSVTGEIAIEDINNTDMNEPNLAVRDVNFIWGDQTFTVRDGNFVAAKKGHSYKLNKYSTGAVNDCNEGKITAKFDLDKCTFTISIKDANNLETLLDSPDVNFGINYGIGDANDFNETADVNLVTRRSY
ncbi:MAG: hypothetical protein ABSB91_06750 [Sedimentisphaerales bacterium]